MSALIARSLAPPVISAVILLSLHYRAFTPVPMSYCNNLITYSRIACIFMSPTVRFSLNYRRALFHGANDSCN